MLKQFQKILIFFVLVVLLLALSVSLTTAQTQTPQPVLRIGVLDDERGPMANAALMAVQEINETGGVQLADGTTLSLELMVESFTDETSLNQAIMQLGQANVIAVLGPQSGDDVLTALSALQSLEVPVITPAINGGVIALDSTGRLFRSTPNETYLGRALADYVVNELGLQQVTIVQLGGETSPGLISFIGNASEQGATGDAIMQLDDVNDAASMAADIVDSEAEIVVTYGDAALANRLLLELRAAGWDKPFANDHVEEEAFQLGLNAPDLAGVVSATSWSPTAADTVSESFFESYFRLYGDIPRQIQAASYDAVRLLAAAASYNGNLTTTLSQLDNIRGVQGIMRPVTMERGETNSNVVVVEFSDLGALGIVARYLGNEQISNEQLEAGVIDDGTPTPTPTFAAQQVQPTPAPDAVVNANAVNIRSNPGQGAEIVTSVRRDTGLTIIGRLPDNSWLQVILPDGARGWVFTNLVRLNKDLNSVVVVNTPIIEAPTPTPTIPPTQAATVLFVADRYTINLGECATISWNVNGAGISQVVFRNPINGYVNEPVNFVDARSVCPGANVLGANGTVGFFLVVTRTNGIVDEYYLQLTVNRTESQPSIILFPDRYNIRPGECLTVSWDVSNLQAGDVVQLNEITVNSSGNQYVCPSAGVSQTPYYINVLRNGAVIATNSIVIQINEAS
jgi:ABC-type branched-subunit amino acid transport system substrate-binding protein/uncharacterized protein YraI